MSFSARNAVLAALLCIFALQNAVAEKGDTYTAVLTASGLPPGSQWVAPSDKKLAKAEVHMQITDNGLSSNQTMKILYEIDFPSDKFLWNEVGLASTDITGAPLFFSMANYSDVGGDFFAFGNFSLGELSSSMIDAGICDNIVANAWCVDYSTLQDNTTYGIVVIDPVNKTALGGVIQYRAILAYGNGSTNDTTGTESDLQSDVVYVATLNSDTISFDQGYQSGYEPAVNGSAVMLFQYLPDGNYSWEFTAVNMKQPKTMELRYFETLASQPFLLELHPDQPFPVPPAKDHSSGSTYTGNVSTQAITDNLYRATGLDWNTVNFNNTPNLFMVVVTQYDNTSILGFVYNAFEAPPPRPVIKGGQGTVENVSMWSATPYLVAAWVVYLFMVLNIVFFSSSFRALKYAERRKEMDKQLVVLRKTVSSIRPEAVRQSLLPPVAEK